MKKIFKLILVVIISFFVMIYFYFFPVCNYSEKEVEIPKELIGKEFVLESEVYLSKIKTEDIEDPVYVESKFTRKCNTGLYDIDFTLDSISDYSRGEEIIKSGMIFSLIKIIVIEPHGINSFDAQNLVYLILSDKEGNKYKILTVTFPATENHVQDDDVILTYEENGEKKFLYWGYFQDYLNN